MQYTYWPISQEVKATRQFGQLIEYKSRSIFIEKSYTKCAGEIIPRSPPYVSQFSWFPCVLGTPYILTYATHTTWISPLHQWVSHCCSTVCRGLSCTKSLLYPLRNKFFAMLLKIIGKLLLSTCFTNLIVDTPCFALWKCFIIRHRSVNFQ